ncbi:bacteriochlorophyll 4-vinyl reductase [Nereida sp. MMG025]|uniref:bacteriochlorophyll 4-vinyl reductase n=1 Tax=Nereida sp. MMG025 TaxID=2909981 RepID=UPI001F013DE8|nr:bacteriochlorophyll 4-vinyl reductase [Nereida sp. MMG025]MCF6444063.1 bacteriochlorophyll 4-vinyl reductase [Nereida sp. MMG025]
MSHPLDAAEEGALIGPNAILQLVPVLEKEGGAAMRDEVCAAAGLMELPDGTAMIPEEPAARLHQALRAKFPDLAPALAREAGRRTADYILAHRIPRPAQTMLKVLPTRAAAKLLAGSVTKHAWTFVGSGAFRAEKPFVLEIRDNPVVRGEVSDKPLCDWHAAVFERLYQELVHPTLQCREVACCAMGAPACRFELVRQDD